MPILRPASGYVTQGGGQAGAYAGPQNWYDTMDPQQNALARLNARTELQRANIANAPARMQQKRFNTVFPWLKGQIADLSGKFGSTVGGESGQGPTISAAPIIDPVTLQGQINAMRARSGMHAATQARLAGRSAAASGMGGSPLLSAMQRQIGQRSYADQMAGERELRLGSAQLNASHLLDAQKAREQQFASRMSEDIARRQQVFGLLPGLLGAISGMV